MKLITLKERHNEFLRVTEYRSDSLEKSGLRWSCPMRLFSYFFAG